MKTADLVETLIWYAATPLVGLIAALPLVIALYLLAAPKARGGNLGALAALSKAIDSLNNTLGGAIAWLALIMTLVQFVIVLMRYVFGLGSIWMQESIVYMHGFLFMLAAGFTLLHNGHVRVDVFYREAPDRRKALVDFAGVYLFLIPVCATLFFVAYPYVEISWVVLEGSKETSGIQGIFLLKTTILVFAVLMVLQGASLAAHSLRVLAGLEKPQPEEQGAL